MNVEIEYTETELYCKCCERDFEEKGRVANKNKIEVEIDVDEILDSAISQISCSDEDLNLYFYSSDLLSLVYDSLYSQIDYYVPLNHNYFISYFQKSKVLIAVYNSLKLDNYGFYDEIIIKKEIADLMQQ